MYHTIEFRVAGLAAFDVPSGAAPEEAREGARGEARGKARGRAVRTQQLVIQRGTRMRAQIKPYVVESSQGPIEVADLLLDDGSFSRAVRFGCFRFVDE